MNTTILDRLFFFETMLRAVCLVTRRSAWPINMTGCLDCRNWPGPIRLRPKNDDLEAKKEEIGRLRLGGGRIVAAPKSKGFNQVRLVRFCFLRLRRQVRQSGIPFLPLARGGSIHPADHLSSLWGAMSEHAAPELPKRCHHCAGPLSKDMETSSWTVTPLVRDSFSMIGSAVGGTAGAFYAFNHAMPVVRRYIKGPMWMHFLVGAPPVVVFSSACAGLAAGTIPALAQLVSSSCHAAMSSPSFARPASPDDMHKSRGSSPL